MTEARRGLTTRGTIVAAVAMIAVIAFGVVGGAALAGEGRGHGPRGPKQCGGIAQYQYSIGQYQYSIGQYQYQSAAGQSGIGQYQYRAGCGQLGNGLVVFCHKGHETKTAIDGSRKMRRHLRHGDVAGPCASQAGQGNHDHHGDRTKHDEGEQGALGDDGDHQQGGDDDDDDDGPGGKVAPSQNTIGGGSSLGGNPGPGQKKGQR